MSRFLRWLAQVIRRLFEQEHEQESDGSLDEQDYEQDDHTRW